MGGEAGGEGEVEWLRRQAAALGVGVSEEQARMLARFTDLLQEASRRVNLTAIRDREEIWVKHHLDSLTVARLVPAQQQARAVDVGSGAGFPGLPLAVVRPLLCVSLVESVRKKASFLRQAVQALGLSNVQVVEERAEVLGHQSHWRERARWVFLRAVGSLAVSLELGAPFAEPGGYVVVMKGPGVQAEWEQGLAHARRGGLELAERQELVLPGGLKRVLLVWQRRGPLPAAWPRRPGRWGRP